jgi:Nickel-dependent hydrogenase
VDIGYIKATGQSVKMYLPKTASKPEVEFEWKIPKWSNAIERDRARTYFQVYAASAALHFAERALQELHAGRTRTWTDFKVPEEAIGCGFHEAVRGVLSHHVVIRKGKIANVEYCCFERCRMASLRLVLASGWGEAEAFAHALPESFPLFRRHMLAALFHATAETRATGVVRSQAAEEDTAQQQKSKRLPKSDLAPAEQRRQQPIPQVQHDFAADEGKEHHRHDRQRSNKKPFLSHVQSLMLS